MGENGYIIYQIGVTPDQYRFIRSTARRFRWTIPEVLRASLDHYSQHLEDGEKYLKFDQYSKILNNFGVNKRQMDFIESMKPMKPAQVVREALFSFEIHVKNRKGRVLVMEDGD